MTGDNLFTHQLPRAAKQCEQYILQQHPSLSNVNAEGVDGTNWEQWLDKQIEIFGETLEIENIPQGEYLSQDPILELIKMRN